MDKELFDFVAERAEVLSNAASSKQETKDAAIAWMQKVDGASDDVIEAATAELVDFLDGRPNTIDGVIAFAQGPAKDMFGEDRASAMLARATERKEQGEKYCDCDACSAAVQILERFDRA